MDLYQVECPKCHINHFTILAQKPKEDELPKVICKKCTPIDSSKGEFRY